MSLQEVGMKFFVVLAAIAAVALANPAKENVEQKREGLTLAKAKQYLQECSRKKENLCSDKDCVMTLEKALSNLIEPPAGSNAKKIKDCAEEATGVKDLGEWMYNNAEDARTMHKCLKKGDPCPDVVDVYPWIVCMANKCEIKMESGGKHGGGVRPPRRRR